MFYTVGMLELGFNWFGCFGCNSWEKEFFASVVPALLANTLLHGSIIFLEKAARIWCFF
jgi:hypothetical protein